MISRLLDALFPRPTVWERGGYWIPEEDWGDIPFSPYYETGNALRNRGISSLDGVLSAVAYRDSKLIQHAIGMMKYKRIPGLTVRLGQYIVRAALPHMHYAHTLVPVPLHWRRQLDRGFNQSALLARYVSDVSDMPVAHVLRRIEDTGHQAWRSRYERMLAMADVFAAKRCKTLPSHVVLIDDIITTGATLNACAEILKNAGVQKVEAWVIARV